MKTSPMAEWKRFESYKTEDLIRLFQNRKTSEADRDDAFCALVLRFREDVLKKTEIIASGFKHSATVAEIVTDNTFEAYFKKGQFKFDKAAKASIDDSFKIYLYGIARNELVNYHRKQKRIKEGKFSDGKEQIITDLPQISVATLDNEGRVKFEVIQSLPYSHRVIYLTYSAYEKLGCNLPKKLQQDLREHLGGIKQVTVRTYKKEACDRIDEALKILALTSNGKS
ncbi:MAG TPA: hypothetical protein VGD65_20180 [Chryseosolibacter sp.]